MVLPTQRETQSVVAQKTEGSEPKQVGSLEDETNNLYLKREKSVHITKAARSATLANVLAPLLCIPMFQDEVQPNHLMIWLGYMAAVVLIRTWIVYQLAYESEKIQNPDHNLRQLTFAVGIVGVGWGLGWLLMAPDLQMVNRMIYVYMITAAMISGMLAYSVNTATFYAFTLPIMAPSLSTFLWPEQIFPWPFLVGLASLYLVVIGIARNFAKTFENAVRLRFRNEDLYQALANERDQSIAANVAKSKFIAIASHDLRQPMHAVNVYLESLNLDAFAEAEKKSLTKIKNSITSLNAMFDSLLNVSKLDADVMQVNARVFHLSTLTSTLYDLTQTKARNKGLSLSIDAPDVFVRGDKLLLQQILSNLILNAIQYTQEGSVQVQFSCVSDCLVVRVCDTGCGISAAEQHQIFHEFYRTASSRSLHDGLGLGLSIVKRLCEMIGADIQVHSQEGQGAEFCVTTPFLVSSHEEEFGQHPSAPMAQNAQRSLIGKCIAVIEDNPAIAEAYRQTLVTKGAHVVVLSENEGELETQMETIDRIDCILSDYRLQKTTGDVLIQKLRDSYNSEIPALIVTADTSPSHINFFANLNVQVLHKPITFHAITQAIEKMVNGK